MKKLITVLIAASLSLALGGCGFNDIENNTSIIVTTTTAQHGPLMTPDSAVDSDSSGGTVTKGEDTEPAQPDEIIFKTTANVNARSGPSTDFEVVKVVSEGTEVVVTGKEDNWYKVQIEGISAYIIEDYLDGDDSLLEDIEDGAVALPSE